MADPFSTPVDLASFANATIDTARMGLLLDLASAAIRGFVGQELSEGLGDQVEYGPTSAWELYLPQFPVTAVSAVEVLGDPVTAFTWTRWGTVTKTSFESWSDGALITYDHGWSAASDELAMVEGICLAMASRAFTMNERSASEVLGSTVLESAGYSPEVFLTPGEKEQLGSLSLVTVG